VQAQAPTQVKLYPNPATVAVNFELPKDISENPTLSIFNFTGRKISETKNMNARTTISVSELPRGVYIYYITDKNQNKVLARGKFQISR